MVTAVSMYKHEKNCWRMKVCIILRQKYVNIKAVTQGRNTHITHKFERCKCIAKNIYNCD